MDMQFSPSSPIVRAIYCLTLISVALSLLRKVGMYNFHPDLGLIFMLIIGITPTIILFLLLAFRFIGIVVGKFKLNVVATSGPIFILRMLAIIVMFVSVAVGLYGYIGILSSSRSEGVGYGLISGIMGGGSPIGLILFEASRLFEREMLIESKPNT